MFRDKDIKRVLSRLKIMMRDGSFILDRDDMNLLCDYFWTYEGRSPAALSAGELYRGLLNILDDIEDFNSRPPHNTKEEK